ncbi:MAG: sigma-70 family RNA polymerase sigma factor [Saccharofermentans sp.]|nr:sigma-70 family RNA polymerase sigma factor [Saccharofermentans sp.]
MDQNQALNNLVERAKHGDDAAFAELYTSAYRTVYVTCNGYLKHPQEAEDVTQEVFIQIYHKLNTLENNLTFYGWAKTIAMHLSLNRIRDNREHASFDDAIANNEINEGDDNIEMLPDTYILKEEKRKILEKIIETELTDVQYQTIFMHYFNEVPVENIAQIMGCPEGTVKTRLKSARVKIKAAIEKYEQTTGDRLIVANAIPSIAMVLKMSAASVPVQVVPFAGFAGAGAGVGSAVAKGAQAAAKGAKATGKASKASKAGKAATAAGGVAAKGLIAKVVGSILAVAVVGVGTVAIAKLVNDNKEEDEPVETTEAVVDEHTEFTEIQDVDTPVHIVNPLKYQIGETITMGNYCGEDITWIVLDAEDGKYLVVTEYVLDAKQFNDEIEDVTWETCSLRQWLNDYFYNESFSLGEKAIIVQTLVTADPNPYLDLGSDNDAGNDTNDFVFLLSVDEAEKYFPSEEGRICYPIECAIDNNVRYEDAGAHWWLRTPGGGHRSFTKVQGKGKISYDGEFIMYERDGIRPAMWITG